MNDDPPVNSALILTLGILSLVFCPLLGLVAWSMGTSALRVREDYEDNPLYEAKRSLIVAGRTCGIIGSLLLLFCLIWVWIWLHSAS